MDEVCIYVEMLDAKDEKPLLFDMVWRKGITIYKQDR